MGGARAGTGIEGAIGVLLGSPLRAARDAAIPNVPPEVMWSWATEQRVLWEDYCQSDVHTLLSLADFVMALGGDVGELPVALQQDRQITLPEIDGIIRASNQLIVVRCNAWEVCVEYGGEFELAEDVLIMSDGIAKGYIGPGWPLREGQPRGTLQYLQHAVFDAWGIDFQTWIERDDNFGRRVIGHRDGEDVVAHATAYVRP